VFENLPWGSFLSSSHLLFYFLPYSSLNFSLDI
jgi:hypothetical protein